MNILLLYVDDLRPQMACYGEEGMVTPNLDRLAAGGTLFERAYSQFPVCGPSRASALSGLRPTTERYARWNARVEDDCPGVLTLPEHFQKAGYATQSVGKVFHDADDCESAWSEGAWMNSDFLGGSPGAYAVPENRAAAKGAEHGPPFESVEGDDALYGDAEVADRACAAMQELAAGEKPFFLAAGFLRPHLPFNAPQKYWDLYDREKISLAANPHPPENVPEQALHPWAELRNYAGIPPEGPLDEATSRTLVHGYYASVSYMDAQIGKVVDEVERLGQKDNTLIVLMADHGWQLGEHGLWCKHCVFETSLHCPLIVSGPGVSGGARAAGLVEYLDVYPTLCEAAGLEVPGHVQGRSFLPALSAAGHPGKEEVFSRQGRSSESVKTDRYRYSEWRDAEGTVVARMLYDHQEDPGENVNIAEQPAARPVVEDLSRRLAAHLAARV